VFEHIISNLFIKKYENQWFKLQLFFFLSSLLYFCGMAKQEDIFKNVISHAKEYGFIFPSSEIYDGLSAVYDYAHEWS
jgi:hypothetical protein